MTSRDFCFWLQGFFELSRTTTLSENQVSMIERHLALVFQHEIDPSMGNAKVQDKLNAAHAPPSAAPSGPFLNPLTDKQDGPIKYRC